jgi:beta-lactamase superfamily II metal-dependent hydrolase
MDSLIAPINDIAEITLLGTGGGYGESCIIHLGDQNWIVVDSCINPFTKECLPLDYLKKIGVHLKTDVKLIICTHWHDDHLLGLSTLLSECESAKFVFSRALDRTKFLNMVALDYKKLEKETTNSSTVEFNKCLNLLRSRGNPISDASVDKILLTLYSKNFSSQIIALSPSEYAVELFNEEISTLITSFGSANTKIVSLDPNSKSIALFIKLGPHRALLGSDLESNTDKRLGWSNIIEFNNSIDKKASFYKIPHHGSINGHDDKIWIELLEPNPLSTLSPYNRGKKLPNEEMIEKLSSLSDKIFITSDINVGDKPKKRDRDFEKLLMTFKQRLKEVKYRNGIIRSQIDMTKEKALWEVTLFENANKV